MNFKKVLSKLYFEKLIVPFRREEIIYKKKQSVFQNISSKVLL